MPKLGLGTWNLYGRECYRAVLSALEIGYRHIDTAQFYNNEEQIGRAITDSGIDRAELYLVSKVWETHFRYAQVLAACEESLRKLGTQALDLYLIHYPSDSVPIDETIRAMNELVETGKVRAIGVSNFSVAQLEAAQAASKAELLCNQVRYHPYYPQQELSAYCQAHDVLLGAYTPLARSRVSRDPKLKAIGDRHGKSGAQVTLRWLIQQPRVITMPKSAHPDRQRENIEIFDFELTQEEMAAVFGLAA